MLKQAKVPFKYLESGFLDVIETQLAMPLGSPLDPATKLADTSKVIPTFRVFRLVELLPKYFHLQ